MKQLSLIVLACLVSIGFLQTAQAQQARLTKPTPVKLTVTSEIGGEVSVMKKDFNITDMTEIDEILKEMELDEPKENQYIEKEIIVKEKENLWTAPNYIIRKMEKDDANRAVIGFYPDESYNQNNGILVESIVPGSGAEKAGIKPGDIIDGINDDEIKNLKDLQTIMQGFKPGDEADITFLRGDEHFRAPLTFQSPAKPAPKVIKEDIRDKKDRPMLGVVISQLGDVEELNPSSGQGLPVSQIIPDGAVEKIGMEDGAVITHVAGARILDFGDLRAIMKTKNVGDQVEVRFRQNGQNRTDIVTLQPWDYDWKEREEAENHFEFDFDFDFDNFDSQAIEERVKAEVLSQLEGKFEEKADGKPFMGVYVETVDNHMAKSKNLTVSEGVYLSGIIDGTGAKAAGLQKGDVIVSIAGTPLQNTSDMTNVLRQHKAGDQVIVGYIRNGNANTTNLTLGAKKSFPKIHVDTDDNGFEFEMDLEHMNNIAPEDLADKIQSKIEKAMKHRHHKLEASKKAFLGINLESVTPDLQQAKGLSLSQGVYVVSPVRGSGAEAAGLKSGDIITSIDGNATNNTSDLSDILREKQPGDQIQIDYNRDGASQSTQATLTSRADKRLKEFHGDIDKMVENHINKEELNKTIEKSLQGLDKIINENIEVHVDAPDPNKPFLGIYLDEVTEQLAEEKGLDVDKGIYVSSVIENTAAKEAGLQGGDVITQIDGQVIETSEDLKAALGDHKPGDRIKIKYLRDGKQKSARTNLTARPAKLKKDKKEKWQWEGFTRWMTDSEKKAYLGVYIETADEPQGVLLTKVIENSAAAEAGLQKGDIIVGINKADIQNTSDLKVALKDAEIGQTVKIQYLRDGKTAKTRATLKAKEVATKTSVFSSTEDAMNVSSEIEEIEVNVTVKEFDVQEPEGSWVKDMNNPSLTFEEFKLYPNPNIGRFTLEFTLPGQGNTQIKVFDTQGRVVYGELLSDFSGYYNKEIDITDNAKGVYFVQITQNDQGMTRKVIVQ